MIDIKKLRKDLSNFWTLHPETLTALLDELEAAREELAQTNRLCEALKRNNRRAIDGARLMQSKLTEAREELELLRKFAEAYAHNATAETLVVFSKYDNWRAKRGNK